MSYFIFSKSEDGDCFTTQLETAKEVEKYLWEYFYEGIKESCYPNYLDKIPKDSIEYWDSGILIIEGEAIQPQMVETVKSLRIIEKSTD